MRSEKKKSHLRQALAALDERTARDREKDGKSLWRWIRSIRSNPVLREWMTLESVVLCPWITRDTVAGGYTLHLLFAVPAADGAGRMSPWGYVQWAWPSDRLIRMDDVAGGLPSEFVFTTEHVCSEAFASAADEEMRAGREVLAPPAPIVEAIQELGASRGSGSDGEEPGARDAGVPETTGMPDLQSWIEATRRLVGESGSEALKREWRRVYARLHQSRFSVVVAGEFSRGKSTLINRLLGEEILPIGVLPTTSALVRVTHGREAALRAVGEDGKSLARPLDEEAWNDLVAPGEDGAVRRLEVTLPHPWLEEQRIDLVDTPGAGDLSEERTAQVLDAIASSDATLVAISATMALSLTERAFVEEHVLAREVPRVAVVLTHLDGVRARDRKKVIDFVKGRLTSLSPQIVFACAHAEPVVSADSQEMVAGPEAIKELLVSWSRSPEHEDLIRRQVRSGLADVLALLRRSCESRLESQKLLQGERESALEEARHQVEQFRMFWDDVRLGIRQREAQTLEWMGSELGRQRQRVLERLLYELARCPQPKQWWERDLPFRLRSELAVLTENVERPLTRRIAADFAWLLEEVSQKIGHNMTVPRVGPVVELTGETDLSGRSPRLDDLGRLRSYVRVGTGAATIMGYMIWGPLGMALSIGTGIVSEGFFKHRIDVQRKELEPVLVTVIDEVLDGALGLGRERLRETYAKLSQTVERQESAWLEVREEALAKDISDSPQGAASFEKCIVEIDELLAQMGR